MSSERNDLRIEDLKYDDAGLIPAVIQQHDTGEVLMVAWMNRDSLAKTCETKRTWFWSRSRKKYWMKGEESGNVQVVREVRYDCDADCLLVLVDQTGAGVACHTGERSCFYRVLCTGTDITAGTSGAPQEACEAQIPKAPPTPPPAIGPVLDDLFAILQTRGEADPEISYTARLLAGPQDQLLKKIGEEATEVVMAAKDHDAAQVRYEAADLVYHLLVVLVREGLTLEDLAGELASRRG